MNLNEYTRKELVDVLEKFKKEYPACYRAFIEMNLPVEDFRKDLDLNEK